MPFQSVPNAAEAVILGTVAGQTIANVLGFQFPGAYTLTDLQALANVVDARVGSDYLPLVNSGITYVQTLVRGLTSVIDLSASENSNTGPGTASGTGVASNVTFCLTLRTGHTGRSARGRFYMWPPVATAFSAPDTLGNTYITAAEDFLDNVRTNAAAINWQMCIISRFSLGVKRTVGITTPVVSIEARNAISDSQRHRLPRGH